MEAHGDRESIQFQPANVKSDKNIPIALREDKSDHAALAHKLAEGTSYAVAVPNYRLTTPETQLHHPGHSEDLLAFLQFVHGWAGLPSQDHPPYDPSWLYLIGHSCSAHMLTSILLSSPNFKAFPSLTPSEGLLQSVRGVIMSEGIYDVDLLLKSFPTYREWFIANTFSDLDAYAAVNTSAYEMRQGGEDIRWLVVHSKGDTLVDEVQSQRMVAQLKTFKSATSHVESYFGLTHEHNDIFLEDRYHEVVSKFITRNEELNIKS